MLLIAKEQFAEEDRGVGLEKIKLQTAELVLKLYRVGLAQNKFTSLTTRNLCKQVGF